MSSERTRRRAAAALLTLAVAAGCEGPAPAPHLSPTADQDPARFESAARETDAAEAANREAERRLMKKSRVAPPGR